MLSGYHTRSTRRRSGFPLRRDGSEANVSESLSPAAMDDLDVSLMRGTLDLLILKAVSWGPRHGYAIVEWIEQATDDAFLIGEGTLYPALHRLERRGLISAEWGVSENNRQAKYYSLARAGRARLQTGTTSWHRFVELAGRALRATSPVTS